MHQPITPKKYNMSVEKTFDKFIENANELGEIAHYEDGHGAGVSTKETALDAVKEYENLLNKLNQSFNTFKAAVNKQYTTTPKAENNDISVLRKAVKDVALKPLTDDDILVLLKQVEESKSLLANVTILVSIVYNMKDTSTHKHALRKYANTLLLIKALNKDTNADIYELYDKAKNEIK